MAGSKRLQLVLSERDAKRVVALAEVNDISVSSLLTQIVVMTLEMVEKFAKPVSDEKNRVTTDVF